MDAKTDADAASPGGFQLGAPAFRSSGISEAQCHGVVSLDAHLGWLRVISDCHFAVQLGHFIPDFLSYSVAVFLK
jgi:hypothetical protein